jgi:hypothetical protein
MQKLKQAFGQSARGTQHLAEIAAAMDNQQRVLNDKLTEVVVALTDMSQTLGSKLDAVVAGSGHEQALLNDKLSETVTALTDVSQTLGSKLDAVVAGSGHEQALLNDKLSEAVTALTSVYDVLNSKLDAVVAGSKHEQKLLNEKLGMVTGQLTEMTDVLRFTLHAVVTGNSLSKSHRVVSWGDRLLTLDKVCGFRENKEFVRALDEIRGSHKYDQYNGPETIAWRLNTLVWAAQCALRTGGSFVECGVFKGDMSWVVAHAIGPSQIPDFFLFDSFEGFSPQYSDPSDFPDDLQFFDFANNVYRQEGLYERVRERFACFSHFKVIKGFLPAALDCECPEKIGYLHIDLNSPRAEVAVLERLFNRVVPGGIVVFDDYGWKLFRLQKEAEDSFMHARGYDILELPTGQGLVVKRSEPEVRIQNKPSALCSPAPTR